MKAGAEHQIVQVVNCQPHMQRCKLVRDKVTPDCESSLLWVSFTKTEALLIYRHTKLPSVTVYRWWLAPKWGHVYCATSSKHVYMLEFINDLTATHSCIRSQYTSEKHLIGPNKALVAQGPLVNHIILHDQSVKIASYWSAVRPHNPSEAGPAHSLTCNS